MHRPSYTLTFSPYSRRFCSPVKTARGTKETREGIRISLCDTLGNTARSEIAPWEGFGCESLNRAETVLREFTGKSFSEERIFDRLSREADLPCTRHAFSAAFFLLKNPEAAKAPEPPNTAICKLILRNSSDCAETIAERISRQQEFRSVKIKIGLSPLKDEIRFCEKILNFAAKNFPATKIRFDANGAWNSPEALTALTSLGTFPQLEFIEQPLSVSPENDAAVYALPPSIAAKFALDESLREPWEMPTKTPVVAVVKPLLVGDFPRLRSWLAQKENAPRFVVSSVFETEAGRDILRFLCRENAENPRALAAGIGTREAFADAQ